MSERGSSSCSTACDFASSSSDSVTFNQICAAVLRRAFLMWRDARRALRHDRVLLRLSVLLTTAWMCLGRRTLRHHDPVLFRLSVVLTATWMRLARGALRFERARQSDQDPGPGPWSEQAMRDLACTARPITTACSARSRSSAGKSAISVATSTTASHTCSPLVM